MKHTSRQFDLELEKLNEQLLLMGGTIESMLQDALDALVQNSPALARRTVQRDVEVDQLEKNVDQLALEILALRQPTARDLRFVCSAFKICTDLERMGDITVNICERIIELSGYPKLKDYEILPKMFELTKQSLSRSLDAFVRQSVDEAGLVLASDDEIDALTRQIYDELLELMKKDAETVERGMKIFFIAKHLERIADHATNIAEQVVFMVKGLDIRHSFVSES